MAVKKEMILCNIPHAGTCIPGWAWADFTADRAEIERFASFLADKDVDVLFDFIPEEEKVVSHLSRVVVDMERFRDDAQEDMAKLGMGLFYTKNENGKTIRREGSTKQTALSLYDAYHAELEQKTDRIINKYGSCFILDCHSFHDNMEYTQYDPRTFPDVCIGYNADETCPPPLRNAVRTLLEKKGFQTAFNIPFSGTLIPLKYTGDQVKGMMLEFNRRIYEDKPIEFSAICQEIIALIQEYL